MMTSQPYDTQMSHLVGGMQSLNVATANGSAANAMPNVTQPTAPMQYIPTYHAAGAQMYAGQATGPAYQMQYASIDAMHHQGMGAGKNKFSKILRKIRI